jgi:hypothetical protein
VELVNTQFIVNPKKNQQSTGQPGGKPNKVDKKCAFKTFRVSINEEKGVSAHGVDFFIPVLKGVSFIL